ncbi:MAG: type II toxin-antitoxin system VapC family toxin [Chloroflexi bacterium]|nr:type II toxin-antitoxin system VapC family toxin [Chloroflexota bacterium]
MIVGSLVVDASVAVKWVIPEEGSDRARALLDAAARGEARLLAPDVYVAEVANVLWKRSHLVRDLRDDEAREALDNTLATLPTLVPSAALASQALELALAFGRSLYDCLYVALALRAGCPLVTADRRLVRAFAPATAQVIDLDEIDAAG